MSQVTIFSGAQRRRRWSLAEKQALVEAAFAPGAVVSHVARSADIASGQLYRWRHELGLAASSRSEDFAQVVITDVETDQPVTGPAILIELGQARVHISPHASAELTAVVLRELVR